VADSVVVPQRILADLGPRIRFTLQVPAGRGDFRLMSAVISFPVA
jgi:hypothetical protein